jgi:hypothetical protein
MRKVLYNILIEFGIPLKLVRLITMCLNEMYSKVCIGKHLSDNFPVQNGLKQGVALSPLLINFAIDYYYYYYYYYYSFKLQMGFYPVAVYYNKTQGWSRKSRWGRN